MDHGTGTVTGTIRAYFPTGTILGKFTAVSQDGSLTSSLANASYAGKLRVERREGGAHLFI